MTAPPPTPGQRWRTGSKVHRTLYIHDGDDPKGVLVGLMDTPELAAHVVEAVNSYAYLKAAVERVRNFHDRCECDDNKCPVCYGANDRCTQCEEVYPCPTIRALDREQPPGIWTPKDTPDA